MRTRVTVRSTLRTKVMALDGTSKALTFRGAGYIYKLASFKNSNSYFVAHFQFSQFLFSQSKLMQTATSLNTRFCKVPSFRFVYTISFLLTKGNLNSRIAVGIFGFYLSDAIRRHFQHGYRHGNTLLGKHASHAHFASNQT